MSLLANGVVAQSGLVEEFIIDVARILVLTVVAAFFGFCIGAVHRWYAAEQGPDGLAVLVGVSVVALYLNTAGALGEVVGGQQDFIAAEAAVFNVVTFFIAAVAAAGGNRLGDRTAAGVFAISGGKRLDRDVGRLVKTVGRMTTVKLPDDIDDIVGYDPVDAETKADLAGRTLVFPRRLTTEELRARFEERLRDDHGVGHVDVEFDDCGQISYLAVGSRVSGLGPTLQRGNAAVAVRADPPNNASPGDVVQVWSADAPAERLATGELRGTAGDIVTLSMNASAARSLSPDKSYRLVTVPVQPRADREFARRLRAAAETMAAVTVAEGSPLVGTALNTLDVAVAAVRTADGEVDVVPPGDRLLAAGETVYAVSRPQHLRRFEESASTS